MTGPSRSIATMWPRTSDGPGTGKRFWFAYVDLASAYAWRGQNAEAAAAIADLLRLRPEFSVQTLQPEGDAFSANPAFRREYQRIVDGARKAGLPETPR